MGNYSFKTAGFPEPINGVVEGHNFLQGVPHTKIYDGYSGLIFRNCNLTNCDVPADSVLEHCLRVQVSFCSHLHEAWLKRGFISECSENCSHVVGFDEILIDGKNIVSNYSYEDGVK